MPCHEKSALHREAMIQLLQRSDAGCRVDAELVNQANAERDYWRAVFQRIVETTVTYLSAVYHFVAQMKLSDHPKTVTTWVHWNCWQCSIHFLRNTYQM